FLAISYEAVVMVKVVDDGFKERIAEGDGLVLAELGACLGVDPRAAFLPDGLNAAVFFERLQDISLPNPREVSFALMREHDPRNGAARQPGRDLQIDRELASLEHLGHRVVGKLLELAFGGGAGIEDLGTELAEGVHLSPQGDFFPRAVRPGIARGMTA